MELAAARILVLLLAAAALVGAAMRIAAWRRGRAAATAGLAGLLAVPRRYLVDLHGLVARDPYAARMHAAAAGGLLLATAIFLVGLVVGPGPAIDVAGLLAVVVMLAGTALVVVRRRLRPATHRSGGAWVRFGLSLTALGAGLGLWFATAGDGGALPWIALALIALGGVEVAVGLTWGGPMRHAFAGALNLAFHPRPDRFGPAARSSTDLKPVPLDADGLGTATAADMPWNRLLNLDTCVQCGRCEAACPAFAAGQPLNPKALVHDLAAAGGLARWMHDYAGNGHPGPGRAAAPAEPSAPIVPAFVAPETLWACTTCRACVDECPMTIEHVDAIVDLRRNLALDRGNLPGRAPLALRTLRETDTLAGRALADRFEWAVDLDLPRIGDTGEADVLLFVGEAGFARRSHRTLRALVTLLRSAGVDFTVLGEAETDCGDTARRLGEEALFRDLAGRLIDTLGQYRFRRILTVDPHAFHCLANEYPAFGGRFDVVHHTTFLAECLADGRLVPGRRLDRAVAYHDPCYLGRYNGEFDAPRAILDAIAPGRVEMERSGRRSRCCGGGGGAPLTDIPGERRIPDMRMDDARATGVSLLAVACPGCMTMLDGVAGVRPEVADVAELLADCLGDRP